jgi:hypothetical protein
VRDVAQGQGLKVKTHVRAGGPKVNHNETLVKDATTAKSLKVKTHVKAGGPRFNHSETLVADRPRKS